MVIYDTLVNSQLLNWAKPSAEKLFAGKRGHCASPKQSEINGLMVRHANRGKTVARLKGGDPFLFGRGGEEAAYLHEHEIPFEIVPGITSASGAAAYAGIPLTDRRLGSMVTLVTGHEGTDKQADPVDWARISPRSTLVIFMGLDQLHTITDRLRRLGWDPSLPAAAIRWGSRLDQRIIEGTLSTLATQTKAARWTSPVLVIVGRVVSLRKHLRWFDTKPLFGRKIVITRAAEQAPEFASLLESMGAEVLGFPTIQIGPPRSWAGLDRALKRLSQFDWILFTSVNGVHQFFDRLRQQRRDIRDLEGIRLGAIGPKTKARLTDLGLRVDAFPEEYRAEALADVIGTVKGKRILIARAEVARDILPKTLARRGAQVSIATVYRTLKSTSLPEDLRERLLGGEIDAVTFTSSSTVDGFMAHFSTAERKRIFNRTKAAVIGPITAQTLKTYGVRPTIKAKRYTIEDLARALLGFFS